MFDHIKESVAENGKGKCLFVEMLVNKSYGRGDMSLR